MSSIAIYILAFFLLLFFVLLVEFICRGKCISIALGNTTYARQDSTRLPQQDFDICGLDFGTGHKLRGPPSFFI